MSLNQILSVLLLLFLMSAEVYATESPLASSAGLSQLAMDPVNESEQVSESDLPAADTNISEAFGSAPLNPAFVQYQADINQTMVKETGLEHGLGDIPSPVSYPELVDAPMNDLVIQEFNSTFDLRDIGKVSAVRDQNGWGTCWAFATFGSLESNLLPGVNRTFSPKNMVNRQGTDGDENSGGGIYNSIAYLTRWDGPVDEKTDPYPIGNWTGSSVYPPVAHVQDVIVYPPRTNRTDTASLKAGLQTWGAAYVSILWNKKCYNASSAGYYMSDSVDYGGGHGVTLVGWNDTFPASAFNEVPPGDGAWIVKNSWGSAWGDEGFFYVSYYDKYLGSVINSHGSYRTTAFFTGEPVDNYQQMYLHDPLGLCENFWFGKPKTGTVATRYNATESGILSAIGFYTNDVNTHYSAVIYHNATEGPLGEEAVRFEGNLTRLGYHTIPLPTDSEVMIDKGEFFSIILSLENTVYESPVALEFPIDGYSSNATAAPEESYYFNISDESFVDLTRFIPNASACVKAYTRSVPVPIPTPTPTPSVLRASFTAKPVSGKVPLTVRFTDTSSGSPTRWFWSFGDGTQSLSQNPEKKYIKTGSYSVILVVRNDTQMDRISKRNVITVQNSTESDVA